MITDEASVRGMKPTLTSRFALRVPPVDPPLPAPVEGVPALASPSSPPQAARTPPTTGIEAAAPRDLSNARLSIAANLGTARRGIVSPSRTSGCAEPAPVRSTCERGERGRSGGGAGPLVAEPRLHERVEV